ncbi:hypothetical protein [Streptomyces sp. 8N616]|uniref:hypothetical protein n=1 Tax=Streptomyces sp. 8N616 TaxID=3457414 RepID=UPI003FD4BB88
MGSGASLEAVLFAAAALRRGRASRVLATATEETVVGQALGGAAALVLDSSTTAPLGVVVDGVSRFVPARADGTPQPSALAAAVRRVTALAAGPGELRYRFCGPVDATPVDTAIRTSLASARVTLTDPAGPSVGAEFGAVSPLLHVAESLPAPGLTMVVAASGAGHLVALTLQGAGPGEARE